MSDSTYVNIQWLVSFFLELNGQNALLENALGVACFHHALCFVQTLSNLEVFWTFLNPHFGLKHSAPYLSFSQLHITRYQFKSWSIFSQLWYCFVGPELVRYALPGGGCWAVGQGHDTQGTVLSAHHAHWKGSAVWCLQWCLSLTLVKCLLFTPPPKMSSKFYAHVLFSDFGRIICSINFYWWNFPWRQFYLCFLSK